MKVVKCPQCEECDKLITGQNMGVELVGNLHSAWLGSVGAGVEGKGPLINLKPGESIKYEDLHRRTYCKACFEKILPWARYAVPQPR